MTSPPMAVNGVVITGSSIGDNSRPDTASEEVRGYDARTGRLKWTWDPIPQDPRDPAFGEWRGAMAHEGGGANAWSALAAAAERDYRVATGEQFVAVAVGGGSAWGAGDYVIAFRLGR